MQQIWVISFTSQGMALSLTLLKTYTKGSLLLFSTKETSQTDIQTLTMPLSHWCKEGFLQADALLFIGACGIAVRTIAPFIEHKTKDPAVLVMDEKGDFVISLLSGHLGGGNALCKEIAAFCGGTPVITTASDVNGLPAVDVWAKKENLWISDRNKVKKVAAKLLEQGHITLCIKDAFFSEEAVPNVFHIINEETKADVIISSTKVKTQGLWLLPKRIVLGIGCKKDTPYEVIQAQVESACDMVGIMPQQILVMASVEKKAKEPGLLAYAKSRDLPFVTYPALALEKVQGDFASSTFVKNTVGVDNVCERAAYLAALSYTKEPAWVLRKRTGEGVSIALFSIL